MHFSGHRHRARLLAVVLTATAAASACGAQQSPAASPPETVTVTEPAPSTTSEPETDDTTEETPTEDSTPEETAADETETDETAEDSTQQGRPAPQCRTDQLRARLYPDTQVALLEKQGSKPVGNKNTVQLRLANVGGEPCSVQGSARLIFTNGQGSQLGGELPYRPDGPGNYVTMGTRDGAVQDVTWFSGVTPCIDPLGVEVYPPGQDEPIRLPWNLGAVCDGVKVQNSPLHAG